MTDTNNTSWGSLLGGGIVGYFLGAANNGGFFGGNHANAAPVNVGYTGAGIGCDVVANGAKLDAIMANSSQHDILNAVAGVNAAVTSSAKQIQGLTIQDLFAQQNNARGIADQFCTTREYIVSDGQKTRNSINAFRDQYTQDRITDLQLENSNLKNQINTMPLYSMINGIQNSLDSVIGGCGVRTYKACCPCSGIIS